ncbi:hypothetical protein ILUMI_19695, partial [Ignelater luminosus]
SFEEYIIGFNDTPVSTVMWLDKETVTLISTFFESLQLKEIKRYDKKEKKKISVQCQNLVLEYNKYMGGVDLLDSIIGRYNINIRSRKWYHRLVYRLVYRLVDIATRKVEKQQDASTKMMNLANLRSEIVDCLCRIDQKAIKKGRPSILVDNAIEAKRNYEDFRAHLSRGPGSQPSDVHKNVEDKSSFCKRQITGTYNSNKKACKSKKPDDLEGSILENWGAGMRIEKEKFDDTRTKSMMELVRRCMQVQSATNGRRNGRVNETGQTYNNYKHKSKKLVWNESDGYSEAKLAKIMANKNGTDLEVYHKIGKKMSCGLPHGTLEACRDQIDRVMVSRKWSTSIVDVHSYRRANYNSDHFWWMKEEERKKKLSLMLQRTRKHSKRKIYGEVVVRMVMNEEVDNLEEKEVENVIDKSKNKKAAGPDGIMIELLKFSGQEMPELWKERAIVPLYKGGNKDIFIRYRGINLLNVAYQHDFKGIVKQLLQDIIIMRQLAERSYEFFITCLLFLKIEFDRVNRNKLKQALRRLEISDDLVR